MKQPRSFQTHVSKYRFTDGWMDGRMDGCGYDMIPLRIVTLFVPAGLIIHKPIGLRESGLCRHPSCEQTD